MWVASTQPARKNPAASKLLQLLEDDLIVEALQSYIESNPELNEGPFLDHNELLLLQRISEGSSVNRIDNQMLEIKLDKINAIVESYAADMPEAENDKWNQKASEFSRALQDYETHNVSAMRR